MASSTDIRLLADAIIKAIPKTDNILTVEKVGELLARPTGEIVKMCKDGTIPAHKLKGGKIWYVSENELKEALFGGNK